MTVFGNRDFERPADGTSAAEHGWAGEDALAQLLGESPLPRTDVKDTRRVVMRVQGGDDIELGRVDGREPAVRMAREAIQAIEDAQTQGEWPQVDDRFIRPGAIVSIDVQRQ